MDKEKVTIIVPVYNGSQTIAACLESIRAQSGANIEIIVVNDGSTDNTREIIEKIAVSDSRVITIHSDHQGVSAARNKGLDVATGKWIAFVDADDTINPDFIKKAYAEFQKTGYRTILAGYNFVTKRTTTSIEPGVGACSEEKQFVEYLPHLIDNRIFLSPVCKLYDASIIKTHTIRFDEAITYGEDLLFNMKYFTFEKRFGTINYIAYNYNISEGGSLSTKIDFSRLKNSTLLYEKSETFCRENNIYDQAMKYFAKYIVKSILYSYDLVAASKTIARREKRQFANEIVSSQVIKKALSFAIPHDKEWQLYRFMLTPGSTASLQRVSFVRQLVKRVTR